MEPRVSLCDAADSASLGRWWPSTGSTPPGPELPSYFHTSVATAIAVQIATTAVGLASFADQAVWPLTAGLGLFALVGAVQLIRFRRLNGVWLGGFASRVVGGTGMAASTSYALALGASIWAALEAVWWLVLLSVFVVAALVLLLIGR